MTQIPGYPDLTELIGFGQKEGNLPSVPQPKKKTESDGMFIVHEQLCVLHA